MIEAGSIEVKRDNDGMWWHPAFPWDDIPEDADARPHIRGWGYEACFVSLEYDAPEDIVERYFESGKADCSYWEPTTPEGDGWILGAIYDSDDGPAVCWMRQLTQNAEITGGYRRPVD